MVVVRVWTTEVYGLGVDAMNDEEWKKLFWVFSNKGVRWIYEGEYCWRRVRELRKMWEGERDVGGEDRGWEEREGERKKKGERVFGGEEC